PAPVQSSPRAVHRAAGRFHRPQRVLRHKVTSGNSRRPSFWRTLPSGYLHGNAMNDSAELLKQLRIERERPAGSPPPSRRRLWIAAATPPVVRVAALAGWRLLRGPDAPEVETAVAVPLTSASAPASVLDASGYVVARRMATVSAKVTGRVQEVLIEEGMRVEAGQVLARLDPIDA